MDAQLTLREFRRGARFTAVAGVFMLALAAIDAYYLGEEGAPTLFYVVVAGACFALSLAILWLARLIERHRDIAKPS